MGRPKSVFLSFSSRDMSYVNEIMAMLKLQGVDVWDYSNEIKSIEAGSVILDRLKKEIDDHDVFIPVISSNSMDPGIGRYTRLETFYALEKGKELQVIKHPKAPDSDYWIKPYSSFSGLLYLDFDIWDDKAFMRAMVKICSKLNVDYHPLQDAHDKLPFWSDFRKEVAEIPKTNYHHSLMMEYLWTFNKHFFAEDYEQAALLIRIFVENCQYLLPDYKPFYPLVVWAVCLRLLGQQDQAELCYLKAQSNRPGYDEENIYAGLGGIALERKDYGTSYAHYRKSLDVSPSAFNSDEKFNFVVASLNADKEIKLELEEFVLNMKEGKWGKQSAYLYNAKSLILSKRGAYERANMKLDEAIRLKHYNQETYLFRARTLRQMGRIDEAITFLENTLVKTFPRVRILARELVEYTKSIPDYPRAKSYFERFIADEENSRKELIDYALICYRSGDQKKMEETARKIIDLSRKSFPETPLDLYYDGFAHFLINEPVRAKCFYDKADLDLDIYKNYLL